MKKNQKYPQIKQGKSKYNPNVAEVVNRAIWKNPELEEMKRVFKELAKK